MDPESRARLVRFYEASLARHGDASPRAVRWLSQQSQDTRFRVLAEAGDWQGASVADVGCGLGDFLGYLRNLGFEVRYSGYDIAAGMVAAARQRHVDARFEVRDVVAEGLPERFDYVVASGTFNIRTRDHDALLRRALAVMYEGCRRAVAFNVLRPVPPADETARRYAEVLDAFYFSMQPDQILPDCRALAPRVVLRDDYDPGDFTVFLYRDAVEPPAAGE